MRHPPKGWIPEHSLPIDSSSMTRFRKRMGSETIEELFRETISSAVSVKELKEKDFEQINVDTTVEEKAISFPTDAKLYYGYPSLRDKMLK